MIESNFEFLEEEFPILFNIGQSAELNLYQDPVTCLFKLRQFGEKITEYIFEEHHLEFPYDNSFHNLLKTLDFEGLLPFQVKDLLFKIKNKGNIAVHQNKGNQEEAKSTLSSTFKIAIWFYETYSHDRNDISGVKFHPPENLDTRHALHELEIQYKALEEKFKNLLNQRDTSGLSAEKQNDLAKKSQKAASKIEMNEAETRELIDDMLD